MVILNNYRIVLYIFFMDLMVDGSWLGLGYGYFGLEKRGMGIHRVLIVVQAYFIWLLLTIA